MAIGPIFNRAKTIRMRQEVQRIRDSKHDHRQFSAVCEPLSCSPNSDMRPAADSGVAVNRDWLFSGIVVDLDPNFGLKDAENPERLFYRQTGDGLTAYVLGTCPRCQEETPLEPALDPPSEADKLAGEAVLLRQPVEGHVCIKQVDQ